MNEIIVKILLSIIRFISDLIFEREFFIMASNKKLKAQFLMWKIQKGFYGKILVV
jgi:hypothetical protein